MLSMQASQQGSQPVTSSHDIQNKLRTVPL
jgi:hypothetical protein